jgi:hypothetical protein
MDFGRDKRYKKHPYWEKAYDFILDTYLANFRENSRIYTSEEIWMDIDVSKSPGVPWTRYGFRTKLETLLSEEYYQYRQVKRYKLKPPVWSVVGKVEWLEGDLLDEGKCRTFIIPPLDLLEGQKRLYSGQNKAMKMFHWSAYGFNPYQGGVDRLAERLLVNPIFITYDVKSWDRILQVMREAYRLRNGFLPDCYEKEFRFVTENTVAAYMILANGLVVKRSVGNCSGSNNTTTDNILCHSFILAFTLLVLYDGDVELVEKVVAALFGDDDVASLPHTDKDVEQVFRECFRVFHMELDPVKVSNSLEGMEFLGFRFKRTRLGWIPEYNASRLIAAFCYQIEKPADEAASLSKAWSLLVMSAGCERRVFDTLADCVGEYLLMFRDSVDPVIRSYVEAGTPTFEDCMDFYLGRESASAIEELFVLPDICDFQEEGWNKFEICDVTAEAKRDTRRFSASGEEEEGPTPKGEGTFKAYT